MNFKDRIYVCVLKILSIPYRLVKKMKGSMYYRVIIHGKMENKPASDIAILIAIGDLSKRKYARIKYNTECVLSKLTLTNLESPYTVMGRGTKREYWSQFASETQGGS